MNITNIDIEKERSKEKISIIPNWYKSEENVLAYLFETVKKASV